MKRVILAQHAGFCYGVERAVKLAEDAAAKGKRCVMLGQLIHNDAVISRLAALGIPMIDNLDKIPNNTTVIIRSHGEGKAIFEGLKQKNIEILDATCPNVSAIHRRVQRAEDEGRQPIIIGTPKHPEVIAIAGWCVHPVVLPDAEALEHWLAEDSSRRSAPLTLVSQTTSTQAAWEACVKKAKKECTNIKVFDTICSATCKRQQSAQLLAGACDTMVVIGDKKSSNTKRLAELCGALCPQTLWIERAEELDPSTLHGKGSVGITAGASTPGWIIKEVYDKMSDEMMEIEESFAELLEKSIKTLNTGEKVTGVITGVTPTEVFVDLGTKHAGYIPASELTDDPTAKVEDLVKVGQEIEVFVVRVNDQEGVVTLSKKRLDTVKSWEDVERACEDGTTVEGIVTEENKGGVVVSIKGVRVFVPASQTGLPREASMSEIMKKRVRLIVTEINRARHRVVGSIRKVTDAERGENAAKVWESIEENKKYEGVVKSLTAYGVFVDIGGVDGMVHVSELSWSRVKNPAEVVKVGDLVNVYVLSFDTEKKKISLGMKDRSQDPWAVFTGKYQVGDTASVKVVKFMTFGAFAEVVPGVDGLIHISQISDHRINKPSDVLREGQLVDVKITEIDSEHKKISLSIRALLEDAQRTVPSDEGGEDRIVATSGSDGTEVAPAFQDGAE